MKMSNFENPTWRTAAILKIVISPYLSRESSEFDEICYVDANFDQGDGNMTNRLLKRWLSFSTNSFKLYTKTRV